MKRLIILLVACIAMIAVGDAYLGQETGGQKTGAAKGCRPEATARDELGG